MRALAKISWREVTEGFSRFLLTMLSVALGVSFLTGTLTLRDSLQRTFNDIIGLSARADVFVVGTKISETFGSTVRRNLPLDYEDKIRKALGAGPVIEPAISSTTARLEDANGEIISNAGASTIVQPYYDDPRWGSLSEGRWPSGAREIVVEQSVLEPNGLKIGDTTNLILNGASRQVTITGSIEFEQSSFGAVQIYMDRDAIEELIIPDKKVSAFEIHLDEGASPQAAVKAIAKEIPADAIVMTRDVYAQDRFAALETGLGFVSIFLLVFVFLSIFIGSFVIANTFAMVVRQRMKQFAMLRAIGAKSLTIFGLVIVQAILVGVIGSIVGLVFGNVLLAMIGLLFSTIGLEIPLDPMSPTVMLIGITTGVAVTILGAILSARQAALANPLEVLRDAGGATTKPNRIVQWLGVAMLTIGAVVAYVGGMDRDSTIVGYGAVLVLFGVLGAISLGVGPVIRQVAKPFALLWRVPTRLAEGNVIRNAKRTASTAGALIIGVALVIAGTVISASLKGGSTEIIKNYLKSDLVLYTGAGTNLGYIPRAEADKLPSIDGIASTNRLYATNALIEREDASTQGIVMAVAPNITTYRAHKVIEGDDGALGDGEILINRLRSGDTEWAIGDEVTLTTPLGKKTGKVGVIVEASALFSEIVIPHDWVEELMGVSANPVAVDIKVEEDADVATVKQDINDAMVKNAPYEAMDRDEIGGEGSSQIDLILTILYALLALSVVTAVFGIINTLALSVMERVREIGMVRAVGMSRRGVMGMITLESVLITVFGTLVGLAVGIGLSFALIRSLANLGISQVIIPWGQLGLLVIGALIVGVLAAVVPARQAAQINELEAMAE